MNLDVRSAFFDKKRSLCLLCKFKVGRGGLGGCLEVLDLVRRLSIFINVLFSKIGSVEYW